MPGINALLVSVLAIVPFLPNRRCGRPASQARPSRCFGQNRKPPPPSTRLDAAASDTMRKTSRSEAIASLAEFGAPWPLPTLTLPAERHPVRVTVFDPRHVVTIGGVAAAALGSARLLPGLRRRRGLHGFGRGGVALGCHAARRLGRSGSRG